MKTGKQTAHTSLLQSILLLGMLTGSHTAIASPPSQPTQLAAERSTSDVSLSWAASSDNIGVAGYNVYRNDAYLTTVSATNYTDTVSNEQTYSYYIVAFDTPAAGETRLFSSRSNLIEVVPASDNNGSDNNNNGPIPTAPTQLTANGSVDQGSITLSWQAATDDEAVTGYNVYKNNQYLTTVSSLSLTDNAVEPNTTYQYYLVAFDEPRNFSNRSEEISATLSSNDNNGDNNGDNNENGIDNNAPDTQAPARVTGLNAGEISRDNVELFWTEASDDRAVEGYNVYRDGNYLDTVFTNAYQDSFPDNVDDLSYQIVAFDAAKNFSARSASLRVSLRDNVGRPPVLKDPFAAAIPSPSPSDPFGVLLEIDDEVAIEGAAPTKPKNLRAELVSNDWAEINWAPSNDDNRVVQYRIYRSDGVIYKINNVETEADSNVQSELDRYWRTTSFVDCNYTRFFDRYFECSVTTPKPGQSLSYEVTAVDNEGQESERSNSITIDFHLEENAPIPYYDDFYKNGDDRFVQEHDLSRVQYFIDDYTQVFEEEFNGDSIDANRWNTGLTWGDNRIINGEQQYFVNTLSDPNFGYDPFKLTGSSLIIEAIPTPTELVDSLPPVCDEADPFGFERCAFLSGALSSHDRFGITYGYVEGRIKASTAVGALSSFYLYHRYPGTGINYHAPEIDILEYLGENPFGREDAFQTYHYANSTDNSINSAPTMFYTDPSGANFGDDFHTYGVLWEPQLVIWYIDGKEIKRITGPQVGRQQMNIVAYLVAGSAWAPTPDINSDIFPLQMEIDYIKAYQRPPFNTNGLYPE